MGHLLPVHEAHQLAHEPFYPKSLIPPRCPCTQPSIMPYCRWPNLRPASSTRTCAQTPPSSFSPVPLRPPPPCHRSLYSRCCHLPSSHCRRCPCSRCHRPFSCRAVAASSHVASSPLLASSSPLSHRTVSSARLTKKTKAFRHLNPLECLAI
jgi:hypothetical protein